MKEGLKACVHTSHLEISDTILSSFKFPLRQIHKPLKDFEKYICYYVHVLFNFLLNNMSRSPHLYTSRIHFETLLFNSSFSYKIPFLHSHPESYITDPDDLRIYFCPICVSLSH